MTSTVTSDRAFVAIVDDNESVRRALARLIGAYSLRVQTYSSGREFLDSLKAKVPACLILDLKMDEMTGLELMCHLAGTGLRIPTIVTTADDEPGMRHRCKLAGAVAFLVKPVMSDSLLEAIKAAMSAGLADAHSSENSQVLMSESGDSAT